MARSDLRTGNHPLIFYSSPVSLQVLASAKIATHLWRHKIDALNLQNAAIPWSWIYEDEPFSCADCDDLLQRIPSVIGGLIDDALKVMLRRILAWVRKYSRKIFPRIEERVLIARIFYDVEVGNDDVITGRRVLACDRVTSEQKYVTACIFCLEEDVVRLWPLIEKNSYINKATLEVNEMIYYWNCIMRKIPINVPGYSDDSIPVRMILYDYLLDYPAILYFWEKLTNEERTSNVDTVLDKGIGSDKFLIRLLPTLNHGQARHVLEIFTDGIITTLTRKNYIQYAVQIWTYFCSFAMVEIQFNVLSGIFISAYLVHGSYDQEIPTNECFIVSEVLFELWNITPEQSKTYFTDNFVEKAFDKLYDVESIRGFPECYGLDVRFLLDLIGRVDLPIRNRLWNENWYKLIMIAKPEYLEQFMKICFETNEEIVRFKEGKMMDYDEVDEELRRFFDCGLFDELSMYINFCSGDQTRVENFKRRIIAPYFCVTTLLDEEKCQKVVKFVDHMFEVAEQGAMFREEFLLSPECEMLKQVYENLDKGCVRDMINIRHFLHSKAATDAIKQECLSHCKQCLIATKFVDFKVDDWRTFVLWCCETTDKWWEFRRSLPVDDIFEKLLTKVIKGGARLEGPGVDGGQVWHSEINNPSYEILLSFGPVDDFLLWLYHKQDIVNKYKEAKLKNRSSRVIKTMLRKNWGTIVDTILMWLLNYDKQRVEEIKASIGSDDEA